MDTDFFKNKFIRRRLAYYESFETLDHKALIFSTQASLQELDQRQSVLDWSNQYKPKVIIVTATKNRLDFLKGQLSKLYAQKGGVAWLWLIVDNGSDDATEDYFNSIGDSRIHLVGFTEKTGYAAPVRNLGLSLSVLSYKYRQQDNCYVFVMDSDDEFYDDYSLREVFELAQKQSIHKPVSFFHGFTVNHYYDEKHQIQSTGTHPHKLDTKFPQVKQMKDVFDYGLTTLSALIPVSILIRINYPNERSFEDNGFAHKLYFAAKKYGLIIKYSEYPVNIKRFHQESMTSTNDKITGINSDLAEIGEHRVSGMRADIVNNLKLLREYFTINQL